MIDTSPRFWYRYHSFNDNRGTREGIRHDQQNQLFRILHEMDGRLRQCKQARRLESSPSEASPGKTLVGWRATGGGASGLVHQSGVPADVRRFWLHSEWFSDH